jgi:hypothetical protein
MYEPCGPTGGLSDVGALPSWLTKVAGAIIRGTTVTVPTTSGTIVVDLSNPASVNAAKKALTGAKINTNLGPAPASPPVPADAPVASGAPTWLPWALAGVAAAFVLPKLIGGRH